MDFEAMRAWLHVRWEWFHANILTKLFGPAIKVGNPDRARKKGERDGDDEQLAHLNKTWREMLRDDPWMRRLMPWVSLLLQTTFTFFATFLLCGWLLPAKHPVLSIIIGASFALIPAWFWVARWYGKIQEKVFAEFKKRFGKHLHLK